MGLCLAFAACSSDSGGSAPSPDLNPPRADSTHFWVTGEDYTPDFGNLMAANAICEGRAATDASALPGGPGAYTHVALVGYAGPPTQHHPCDSLPNEDTQPLIRPDGMPIADSCTRYYTRDADIAAPVVVPDDGFENVWMGVGDAGLAPTDAAKTCNDWTTAVDTGTPTGRRANLETAMAHGRYSNGEQGCGTGLRPLLCASYVEP